jgi:hexosaminidase
MNNFYLFRLPSFMSLCISSLLGSSTKISFPEQFRYMRRIALLLLCFLLGLTGRASTEPALIPLPNEMTVEGGSFNWSSGTPIQAPVEAADPVALLRTYLGPLVGPIQPNAPVVFEQSSKLSGEAYEVQITPLKVVLRAGGSAGWENAIQTLRQLMPPDRLAHPEAEPIAFPCVSIKDAPRFRWRGLMLDCSRHFFDKEYIEKFLDVMALHKLNVFHWHLTDNTGWRLEIKKYPLLTQMGSWNNLYGKRSDGFYTQDDAREIVRYAAERNITVVPEIDMPGHSQAALVSYPFLSCGPTYKPAVDYRGRKDANLNVGNDKTYQFIDDVLSEVTQIFPSQFIHIGSDEVAKGPWLQNPDCQALMRANNLKDGNALQSYFVQRVQSNLTSKGKRLIGWDEILEGGLAPGAVVMVWHERLISAVFASGNDLILTPRSPLYFDKTYSINSVEKVYGYEPIPPGTPPDQARHLLGAQGNIWTESVSFPGGVDDRVYPRACALAEIDWSSQPKNFADFSNRLSVDLKRLDVLGVHYHDTSYKTFGQWVSRTTPKSPTLTQWKATGWIADHATNYLRFRFSGGASPLEIDGADVLANGHVIASDLHQGVAGIISKDNVFVFSLPELAPGTQLTLRATINGQGSQDSNGDIEVKHQPLP